MTCRPCEKESVRFWNTSQPDTLILPLSWLARMARARFGGVGRSVPATAKSSHLHRAQRRRRTGAGIIPSKPLKTSLAAERAKSARFAKFSRLQAGVPGSPARPARPPAIVPIIRRVGLARERRAARHAPGQQHPGAARSPPPHRQTAARRLPTPARANVRAAMPPPPTPTTGRHSLPFPRLSPPAFGPTSSQSWS